MTNVELDTMSTVRLCDLADEADPRAYHDAVEGVEFETEEALRERLIEIIRGTA